MARILITGFCSIPSPSRPGVQLGHVIEGLRRQHQVDVLSVRRDDQGHVEHIGETRYLRVPLADEELSAQTAVFRRALRRQISGADYDVVHFRDGWSGVTALEMQAHHGFATVFDLARSPMAEPILTDLATATELERAEKACVRRADLILAPTEPSRQYLAGFTSEAKIHVVPPGVNVDRFDWEALSVDRAPIILYLGTLAPGRGVRVLLRSMLDVAAASNAVLVLAGPASEEFRESLETAVHDLGLEGRVRLLGEIPHSLAPAVIARATVCVAPGAAELSPKPTALFPTKLLEYMACKRAVVAPARGSVKMLFRDGEEGLMFTPGAPDQLAEKLLLLLRDRPLRNRLASAGYEMVRANCTASGTRRSLRRAYGWLAEQAPYRERLGAPTQGEAGSAPITELGLDLILRQEQGRSEEFAAEVSEGTPLQVQSPSLETGDVTRVEMRSVRDEETPTAPEASEPQPALVSYEGTEEWDVPLEVIEDTGSVDIEDLREPPGDTTSQIALDSGVTSDEPLPSKPKTVVTAPIDDSLVSGELPSKPARPELQRPLAEGGLTPSAADEAPIAAASQATRVVSLEEIEVVAEVPKAPSQATRVVALEDIEASVANDEPGDDAQPTRVVSMQAVEAAAQHKAPGAGAPSLPKDRAPKVIPPKVIPPKAPIRNAVRPPGPPPPPKSPAPGRSPLVAPGESERAESTQDDPA